MDRLDEWGFKSKKMDLEEDFYFDYGAEEITDYQDPNELLAALKQKEEEVILAAQLGNALLLENRQLKDQSDKLHEQYADKLEELEQGRHELRLKLEGCQSQWESQVGDLERDVRELSAQVERLTQALSDAERDKSRAQLEHSEHTQRLREQLNTAMEVERAMSSELQALKQELQQKGSHNRPQDEELISAMREQALRLTQKEQVLEERLENVCQENTELRASLASLHARLAVHDQLNQQHSQQLAEAWQEVEAAQGRSQQLQAQVEELQEEVSLQEARYRGDTSLLSELESSLETAGLGVSKEEIKQEMGSILQLLLPLTQEPNSSGRSEVAEQQEGLQAVLHQLKGVARTLAQASGPQELNRAFVGSTGDQCGNPSAAQELRDQNVQLQQENAELRQKLQSVQEQADVVQQAIRDRDEAIAKKNLMEAELVRSKNDMMSLNNQLLEAIQRKLELSQELEAWQSPPSKKRKLEKARKPLSFTLPEPGLKELQAKASALGCTACSPVDSVAALVEKTLTDLKVLHKRVPCRKQEQSLFLTAVENTWIHGRQKRREGSRQLRELPRAPHCAGTSSQTAATTTPASQTPPASTQNTQDDGAQNKTSSSQLVGSGASSDETSKDVTHSTTAEQKKVVGEDVDMESSTEAGQETEPKETPAAASELPSKRPLSPGVVEHFLFKCLLNVMLEESDVVIEMHWVEGQSKDLMNQLCTYLKNTLLKSVAKS